MGLPQILKDWSLASHFKGYPWIHELSKIQLKNEAHCSKHKTSKVKVISEHNIGENYMEYLIPVFLSLL